MKSFIYFLSKTARKFTTFSPIVTIKRSLISLIPILMIGAFSLTLRYFPIDGYQVFLSEFWDGFIGELLDTVYGATFGLLSVYMCISVGYHYSSLKAERGGGATIGCVLSSVASFVILTGSELLSTDTLGPKGMFIAIIASLGASALFCLLKLPLRGMRLLSAGADVNLNNAVRLILPMALTVGVYAVVNNLILILTGEQSVHALLLNAANGLFSLVGGGFFGGLLFVALSSLLWFFGIHGSDVLEGVAESFFIPNIDINIALNQAGQAPTEILTKQFFDVFVLMGGCGSAICLLIALFIFSKRKSNRGLAKMSSLPMLFNINEIMVFGLPIIYNPTMLIPFLTVPVVCYLTSYLALFSGLVPLVISPVEWTTPVIFGGYTATGSVMGSLLQIFNIALGVLIYRPFVKKYDEERAESTKRDYEHLLEVFKQLELRREAFSITELSGADGAFAKSLAAEIGYAIDEGNLEVYYQPQYDLDGRCFGAEALLRLKLSELGMIYPPLVIALAKETGKLQSLEKHIFRRAKQDSRTLWDKLGCSIKMSINISGESLESADFEHFLIELAEDMRTGIRPCIEITEQTALVFDEQLKDRINRLKSAGYIFAIDDFSAGNTSLQYLQENFFDIVKLDGSIVQNCLTNERCNELTTMIIGMSHSLGFKVVAEFVSSEEIRDCMARAGCTMYQGWFYSPAIEYLALESRLQEEIRMNQERTNNV